MNESAELFSNPGNYAVVQLPGRKFSGVVFQGDSLHSLTQNIEELREMALKFHDNEVNIGFADICETLNEVRTHYESECAKRQIQLPYSKS